MRLPIKYRKKLFSRHCHDYFNDDKSLNFFQVLCCMNCEVSQALLMGERYFVIGTHNIY